MNNEERDSMRRQREVWARDTLAAQVVVIEDLAARADDPVGWSAVDRQARAYLRHLKTWQHGNWFEALRDAMEAQEATMTAWVARADEELCEVDPDERAEAAHRVGLRLAVIGKGGSGKTVISSTLARLLGRQGRRVLVADLDVNPGLTYSIGMGGTDISLPVDALEPRPGAAYGWQLRQGLLPRDAVERFSFAAPDGVRVTGLGKIGGADKTAAKRTVVAVVELLLGFGEPGWDVIGDLEAGPTTPFERYHAFADDVVIVVGPAWRSAMTARRLLPMVGEGRSTTIVANRFRNEPDHPGLSPQLRIPFDPEVALAERQGLCPLEVCPDSPTIAALRQMADLLASRRPGLTPA